MEEFDSAVKKYTSFLENEYVSAGLSLFLIVYASLVAPKLPDYIVNLFDYTFVKLLMFFLIVYISRKNATVAIIAAVAVLVSIMTLNKLKLGEQFKSINASNNCSCNKNTLRNNREFFGHVEELNGNRVEESNGNRVEESNGNRVEEGHNVGSVNGRIAGEVEYAMVESSNRTEEKHVTFKPEETHMEARNGLVEEARQAQVEEAKVNARYEEVRAKARVEEVRAEESLKQGRVEEAQLHAEEARKARVEEALLKTGSGSETEPTMEHPVAKLVEEVKQLASQANKTLTPEELKVLCKTVVDKYRNNEIVAYDNDNSVMYSEPF
jgi:hypothetical protein